MRLSVGNFNVHVAKDYGVMSKIGAMFIASQVLFKPTSVLGLATGGTAEGLYKELISFYNGGVIDFSNVTTFNLDEYYPINRNNNQSYYYFMHNHLFNHVNIKPNNIHVPNGETFDINNECIQYESRIKAAGGIDLQLLGIGNNGHIAFNEPNGAFSGATHVVTLAQSTIEANSRFFNNVSEVPAQAVTVGIGTIMAAKRILLLASGKAKAQAVKEMLFGEVTPQMPASALRLHRAVDVVITKDIGDLLNLGE